MERVTEVNSTEKKEKEEEGEMDQKWLEKVYLLINICDETIYDFS